MESRQYFSGLRFAISNSAILFPREAPYACAYAYIVTAVVITG